MFEVVEWAVEELPETSRATCSASARSTTSCAASSLASNVRLRDADPHRPPRHGRRARSCQRWRVDLAKARYRNADEPILRGSPVPGLRARLLPRLPALPARAREQTAQRLLTIHNLAYLAAPDGRAARRDRRRHAWRGRRRRAGRRGAVGTGLGEAEHEQHERDQQQHDEYRGHRPRTPHLQRAALLERDDRVLAERARRARTRRAASARPPGSAARPLPPRRRSGPRARPARRDLIGRARRLRRGVLGSARPGQPHRAGSRGQPRRAAARASRAGSGGPRGPASTARASRRCGAGRLVAVGGKACARAAAGGAQALGLGGRAPRRLAQLGDLRERLLVLLAQLLERLSGDGPLAPRLNIRALDAGCGCNYHWRDG